MHPKSKVGVWGKRQWGVVSAVITIILLSASLISTSLKKDKLEVTASSSIVDQALWFGKNGHFESAIEELDRAIEIDPKEPTFYALRASYLDSLESHTDQLKLILQNLDMAIKMSKKSDRKKYYEQRIELYLREQLFENALTDLDRMIDLSEDGDEQSIYILRRASILKDDLSEFEAAFREYERALTLVQEAQILVQILVEQADLYLSLINGDQEEFARVKQIYHEALSTISKEMIDDEEKMEYISSIWLGLKVFEKEEQLAMCMEYFELFAPILQQEIPDIDLFMRSFDRFAEAKEISKGDARYYGLKADFYGGIYTWKDKKKDKFLIKQYSKAIKLGDQSQKEYFLKKRASVWDDMGKHTRAEKDYAAVLDKRTFHETRAKYYDSVKEFSLAEKHYRKIKDRTSFYKDRATYYDAIEQFSRADRCWKKVLSSDEYYEKRAAFYDQKKMYQKADRFYKKLLSTSAFYAERAAFYSQKGFYGKAEDLFDDLIKYAKKRDRKNLNAYYVLRAANYDALGKYDKADKDFKRAFKKQEFIRERAKFYFCQGMTNKDKKEKFDMLKKAEDFYDEWKGRDIEMELERIYFYKMMNRKKKLKKQVNRVKRMKSDYANEFLDAFLEKHTLDYYHEQVDPCKFSEILENPLSLTDDDGA
jgi:tetratricopeptide (TPR) repeat protein